MNIRTATWEAVGSNISAATSVEEALKLSHLNYTVEKVLELSAKACKSKNYFRCIKRVDSITFNIWLEGFKEDIARTEAFLAEQEALPFEQSQKQVLIQKGELK